MPDDLFDFHFMKAKTIFEVLIVSLALPVAGIALDRTNFYDPIPRNADPRATEQQFSGKIAALDIATKTVTLNDANKNSQTVRIGDRTRITRGGSVARWEDLSVGMLIEGTCVGEGSNTFATSVNIK
jgi:hypothetical protein